MLVYPIREIVLVPINTSHDTKVDLALRTISALAHRYVHVILSVHPGEIVQNPGAVEEYRRQPGGCTFTAHWAPPEQMLFDFAQTPLPLLPGHAAEIPAGCAMGEWALRRAARSTRPAESGELAHCREDRLSGY